MKCVFCQSDLIKELSLRDIVSLRPIIFNACCASCYENIQVFDTLENASCQFCHKKGALICEDCFIWQKEISDFSLNHGYLFEYNEQMKAYFQRYKFLGDIELSKAFSKDIYDKIFPYVREGYLIIPVPLSRERFKERGFNQVTELLKASRLPTQSLLVKKSETEAQSQKNRQERLESKQPFCLKKGGENTIHKRKVLIIDDVYTTGRTILHAYECVWQAKPSEIVSFSLTR